MKLDKMDLALEALVSEKFPFVAVCEDGASWATDGYLFGEYRSPRRGLEGGGWVGIQHLTKEDCRKLKKLIPTGIRNVKEGFDFVEAEGYGTGERTPNLDDDVKVSKALGGTPEFTFSLDPDLLHTACKFLFAGHTAGQGRKTLKVQVYRVTIQGREYPLYEMTNSKDPSRRVVLCGQKETNDE